MTYRTDTDLQNKWQLTTGNKIHIIAHVSTPDF